MKTLKLTIILLGISVMAKSQVIQRNNVYLELGGASVFYSLNYERLLFNKTENNLALRIGGMYINLFDAQERQMVGIPIGISYLKRIKENNYLEAGLSFSVIRDTYNLLDASGEVYDTVDDLVLTPSFRIGYRHQPVEGGFFWNVLAQGSLLMYGNRSDFKPTYHVFPSLSVGVGYTFKLKK